ncbi:MAG: GNAT family N-acetyltransferase [Alloprevotella sp.]|nr:GNAT family N-acetyltransferase [Alloprevotella sp.]
MRLVKLETLDTIKPFDCADSDLNGFLFDDALFYHGQMLANTFVLEDDEETIAYYSLLNDKISQTTIEKNLWRKLRKSIPHEKHLGSYPAVKIGRLAVSQSHKAEGIGTNLIFGIKQMLIENRGNSACRFLTVDAYRAAVPFYEKNGFKMLVNEVDEDAHTVPMYYDLKQMLE